ncbi:MAG: HAD-IA family hydrolase [Pseudobdellovibrionaceae bacterium]
MKANILWDLDGTLTDPKEGIIRSIQYALEKTGQRVPPMDELLWCIGPPLYDSFPELVPGGSKQDVQRLIDLYRERFAQIGLYENLIYPEIPDLLARLSKEKKMFLATSKPHVYAKRIIDHFDLTDFFTSVHGSELSGERADKGDLIRYILETEGIAVSEALIIGDRKHDIHGAQKAGIISVGITWGYGSRKELQDAGADWIFDRPQDLASFLLSSHESNHLN